MKKIILILLGFLYLTPAISNDAVYDFNEKLLDKKLNTTEILGICNQYKSSNIDLGQLDQMTLNIAFSIENYCETIGMRAEFKSEAKYDYIQDGWAALDLEKLDFKFFKNNSLRISIPKNPYYTCKINIKKERRITFYDISRRCGVEEITTYDPNTIKYKDDADLKNNWINIIDYFYADANKDDFMDLVIRFQVDGSNSMGARTMTAIVTSFYENNYIQIMDLEKRYIDQSATYAEYLGACSKYKRSYNFTETSITEVEVFVGENLDIDCLSKKFEKHHKTFPVKSYSSDKPLMSQNIIQNKETLKSISKNISYERNEMSSIVDQKCGENCVYTSEALIIYKNKYWYIKGSNDRGLKAEMFADNDLLITNLMSTHQRKYNFDNNNIVRLKENLMTSFAKDDDVYLNACGPNPQRYYSKPLNIQNIVTEVPNRITYLEKSEYERDFQTIANSTINLDGKNIDISVSNFRDLMIRDNDGQVLAVRKITGASSLYEIKHKGKVAAWGVGWHKNCGNYYDTDFTAFRIFLPVKKNNKVLIEQKVISLNLTQTYKATENSEHLILSDAVTIEGSSRASSIYYGGNKFYQLDHLNGFKSIDSYVELHEKIDVLQLNPTRIVNLLSGFYETEILNKYTKANFDNIYKDIIDNYRFNIYHEFNDEFLEPSINDLNISDKYKKALIAVKNRELLLEDFPPVVWEISNIKKNCFKQDTYESLKELARNCYFFHSSFLLEYTFWDGKWFANQTEFKDSKDLLNADKDKRFKQFLENTIWNIKSFNWDEGTVLDELLSIFERANGGYTVSEDKKYVVISGCEYKNCTKKGLVFIETGVDTDELGSTIALIRHLDYQPDKTDARTQSDDWLILSQKYESYKDLPKEFFKAVDDWRVALGKANGEDPLPLPRIVRYIGGYGNDIEVLKKDEGYIDRRGWLGVRVDNNDADGVRIVSITEGGPADNAGIKVNDIIVSLNANQIKSTNELVGQVTQNKAGEIADLELIRDGKKILIKVKLGSR